MIQKKYLYYKLKQILIAEKLARFGSRKINISDNEKVFFLIKIQPFLLFCRLEKYCEINTIFRMYGTCFANYKYYGKTPIEIAKNDMVFLYFYIFLFFIIQWIEYSQNELDNKYKQYLKYKNNELLKELKNNLLIIEEILKEKKFILDEFSFADISIFCVVIPIFINVIYKFIYIGY